MRGGQGPAGKHQCVFQEHLEKVEEKEEKEETMKEARKAQRWEKNTKAPGVGLSGRLFVFSDGIFQLHSNEAKEHLGPDNIRHSQ